MGDRGCLSTVAAVVGIVVGLTAIAGWFSVEPDTVQVGAADLAAFKGWIQEHSVIGWLSGLALVGFAWSAVFAFADEFFDHAEGMLIVTATAVFFAGLMLGWLWLFGSILSGWVVTGFLVFLVLAAAAAVAAVFEFFPL